MDDFCPKVMIFFKKLKSALGITTSKKFLPVALFQDTRQFLRCLTLGTTLSAPSAVKEFILLLGVLGSFDFESADGKQLLSFYLKHLSNRIFWNSLNIIMYNM